METISIFDGLVLTVVSMLVVFLVLGAIWGLVELISKFMPQSDTATEKGQTPSAQKPAPVPAQKNTGTLAPNKKHQKAAEIIALILASEDQPDKNFEIVESKRVK